MRIDRLFEAEAALLRTRGVRIERSPVVDILDDAPRIEALRLADGQVVPIDALFVGARTEMASDLAQQLGCAFDEGPLGMAIRVDTWKQTSVPGVFAAGDASSLMTNATFASASGVGRRGRRGRASFADFRTRGVRQVKPRAA